MMEQRFDVNRPNTNIIAVLKKHGTISVDFLAKIVNQSKSDVMKNLRFLQDEDLVEIVGQDVRLKSK